MPTLEVSQKDLCKLIGKKIPLEKLTDDMLYAKGEIDSVKGDMIKIDSKDTNRPDLWSVEGVAREIRARYKPFFPKYKIGKSKIVVYVDKKVNSVRPKTVCAVVKNVRFDENALSQIIQLQEKVSGTYGRNRKEVAIGVYDLSKIKSPIRYTTVKPDEIKFAPLGFNKELTPRQILKEHLKGKEFGHLLKDEKEYPVFLDAENQVLSMPPIINSDYTGKVSRKTKNVFIECTGFDFRYLKTALNVIVAALYERGAKIESVNIKYGTKTITTPDMAAKKTAVDRDYINSMSGLNLSDNDIYKNLEKALYKITEKGRKIKLLYPAYRQDIMHQRDVVEDVIISYGYNKIESSSIKLHTVGRFSDITTERFHDILVGLGFQEVMNYTLSNKDSLFRKMCLSEIKTATIENAVSSNWSVFRCSLTPSLLETLAKNQHVEYPHKIYEIGTVVHINELEDTKTIDKKNLCAAFCDNNISYEIISSYLDAFMQAAGVKYELKETSHKSFIDGRVACIFVSNKNVGVVGEIHPQVLNNWHIEKPAAVFEICLSEIK
jgi:phenylalanyl-tRNA synthetase beta chain